MTTGDRVTLTIEKPAAGGRMIARHQGAVVLVSGAIPGEMVEAEIEKVQRGTAWARTRHVIRESPDRVEVQGDQSCGGNVLAHVAYERQRLIKADIVRDAFTRIAHIPLAESLDVAASPVEGYRMRARLHVREGRIGFFREGTHALCDAMTTRQLRTDTIGVIKSLEARLSQMADAGVSEVEVAENCAASERALHLILHAGVDARGVLALGDLPSVRGISCSVDAVSKPLVVSGTPDVSDTIDVAVQSGAVTMTLTRRAQSFFQGNRYLLAPLVSAVINEIGKGRVLDLYAGVGLFSVALAARGANEVVAVEGDRVAARDLKRNAKPFTRVLATHHLPVEACLREMDSAGFATVLVDPPRTGMSKDALRGAVALQARRLVYLSCDVATLARDARAVVDGGYTLRHVQSFDLFPNTAHVETLAVFERGGGGHGPSSSE